MSKLTISGFHPLRLLKGSVMGKRDNFWDSFSYDGCKVGYQKRSIFPNLDHSIKQAMNISFNRNNSG